MDGVPGRHGWCPHQPSFSIVFVALGDLGFLVAGGDTCHGEQGHLPPLPDTTVTESRISCHGEQRHLPPLTDTPAAAFGTKNEKSSDFTELFYFIKLLFMQERIVSQLET